MVALLAVSDRTLTTCGNAARWAFSSFSLRQTLPVTIGGEREGGTDSDGRRGDYGVLGA